MYGTGNAAHNYLFSIRDGEVDYFPEPFGIREVYFIVKKNDHDKVKRHAGDLIP